MSSESYWQKGFNDGCAGKPLTFPSKDGPFSAVNRGYANGWRAGKQNIPASPQPKPGDAG